MCESGGCASSSTLTPTGCPTTQSACASSLGGGCCNSGWGCTVVSETNYCASGSQSALRTGPDGVHDTSAPIPQKSGGLSAAAKAGIGGGIGGLGLVIVGAVLYFCVLQRRRARMVAMEGSVTTGVPPASQVSEKGGKTRPAVGWRQTSEHFGPEAKVGPYTESNSLGFIGFQQRGVPRLPQGPDDIAVPVEIGDYPGAGSPTTSEHLKKTPTVIEYPIEMP
jgi:hypothetical protein